jgi:phosphatidylglycerol lysyltransferase
MVEPQTLAGVVEDRRLWVARRPSPAGPAAVGFLLASPVPQRNGWLIEQIVRTPRAPNGTAELLIDTAMRRLAAEGSAYVTLGLVALSSQAAPEMRANPRWLRILAAWAKAHGRRFYNFDGLEAFRVKLCPDSWETIYAISNEPTISLQTLYAVAAAFSAGSPLKLAAQTLARAVLQEFRWLRQKVHHQSNAENLTTHGHGSGSPA